MDELYVVARSVLLDALEAIGTHRDAVVVIGAQAVYLRVGDADLAVVPYTTDGDLAVDPAILAETPPLELALQSAGFRPKASDSVGIWVTERPTAHKTDTLVAVDLLVPAGASPAPGRRAARLAGHEQRTARKTVGIEGVLVDADVMRLGALDPADTRSFEIRVAGPAALLAAKVHKIRDRSGSNRQSDKDALDVLRLLRGSDMSDLAARATTGCWRVRVRPMSPPRRWGCWTRSLARAPRPACRWPSNPRGFCSIRTSSPRLASPWLRSSAPRCAGSPTYAAAVAAATAARASASASSTPASNRSNTFVPQASSAARFSLS